MPSVNGSRWVANFNGNPALLANFLYSPPGLLQIANAETQLPGWLLDDYRALYEQTLPNSTEPAACSACHRVAPADFGVFPSTLQELVGNRIQLNRLLGLSNLYYIDPEDQKFFKSFVKLDCP